MAGNTQMNLGSIPSLIGHIRGGKLKPLGVGGKKRNAQLPNVPTMGEAGVPGYVTYIWWAIFAPLKTPPEAIKAMHSQVMTSLDSRELLPKLEAQGVEIQRTSPAELGRLMAEETKQWADVIRRAGIKGE
jgi:tripartite-type tricarboxylate transporter receptor subunit TctC